MVAAWLLLPRDRPAEVRRNGRLKADRVGEKAHEKVTVGVPETVAWPPSAAKEAVAATGP